MNALRYAQCSKPIDDGQGGSRNRSLRPNLVDHGKPQRHTMVTPSWRLIASRTSGVKATACNGAASMNAGFVVSGCPIVAQAYPDRRMWRLPCPLAYFFPLLRPAYSAFTVHDHGERELCSAPAVLQGRSVPSGGATVGYRIVLSAQAVPPACCCGHRWLRGAGARDEFGRRLARFNLVFRQSFQQ